ncbi:hypothetical protein [Bacillus cereus]
MSKVNVDEIKVGDLVGFDSYAYEGQVSVGYVTRIETKKGSKQFWGHFGSSPMPGREEFLNDFSVDYHWKVINFEEETKMKDNVDMPLDELKVYTGKETIEALLEGKVLRNRRTQSYYKMDADSNLFWNKHNKGEWTSSTLVLRHLLRDGFTEVATPQVGDWVRVYAYSDTYVGKITRMDDTKMYADWEGKGDGLYLDGSTNGWEILTPEQVSEYKREQAFVKVGRKLNEFREDDFVVIDSLSIVGVIVSKSNADEIRVHKLNEVAGYTVKPHQLTPIYFAENQVSLD